MDGFFLEVQIYLSAAGIVSLTWAVSRLGISWSSPPTFFLLMWSMYIIVPLLLAPHFYVGIGAILWLLGMAMAWAMGTALGYGIQLGPYRDYGTITLAKQFSTRRTAMVIVVGSLIGSLTIVMGLKQSSAVQIAGSLVRDIELIARYNAAGRYQGDFTPTQFQNLLLSFAYFSAILGGLFAASQTVQGTRTRKGLMISILPIVVIAVFGVIQNTKASVLYGIALWLGGYLPIHARQRNRISTLLKPKAVVVGVSIFGILLGLFYWMQATRYSQQALTLADSYNLVLVYAVGHLGGFSYWFDNYFDSSNLGLGENSFAGLLKPFGMAQRTAVPIQLPKPLWQNLETNVDTAFSELIQDFGVFGSLVVVSALATVVTISYRLFVRGHLALAPLLVAFYSVTLWSFTTNLFNYTSILAAFLFFALYVFLSRVRVRKW